MPQGGQQNLLDIGGEAFAVDRAFEQQGGGDPVVPQRGQTRLGIEGLIVVSTASGGPAENASVRDLDRSAGNISDVITQVDDKQVRRHSDLTDQLEQVGAGKNVRLRLSKAPDRPAECDPWNRHSDTSRAKASREAPPPDRHLSARRAPKSR